MAGRLPDCFFKTRVRKNVAKVARLFFETRVRKNAAKVARLFFQNARAQ